MPEIKIDLVDDKTAVTLTFSHVDGPVKFSAQELGGLIQHLGWIRALMLPPILPVDLTLETPVSAVPAVRWQVTDDPKVPGLCRLLLLHPGFGWLYIPLGKAAFDDLSKSARIFLQEWKNA
jgi:hypothetical protein